MENHVISKKKMNKKMKVLEYRKHFCGCFEKYSMGINTRKT